MSGRMFQTQVLGGNGSKLEGRPHQCRLTDKCALTGEWFLLPVESQNAGSDRVSLSRDEKKPCIVGSVPHSSIPGNSVVISSPEVHSLFYFLCYFWLIMSMQCKYIFFYYFFANFEAH
ncbi:hypothetical protein L1887_18500 [Cichorium endivia]|nr:hypothetical protein L1887_18500 [Cichorium endivia]